MKVFFGLAIAAALSGCVEGAKYNLTGEVRGDARAIRAASEFGLRDVRSARFGPQATYAQNDFGFRRICGTVNAKNGFGGYVGFQPYLVLWKPADPDFAPVMHLGGGAAIDCGTLFTNPS